MSEQLVLILLIALTLVIVLIALAIPDEAPPDSGSIAADPPVTITPDDEVSGFSDTDERRPPGVTTYEEQGADHDDARRAADVPEEAGR